MKNKLCFKPILAILLLFGFLFAFGQDTPTVNSGISGKVVEESSGSPLSGVTVTLETPARSAVTNSDGQFTISNLPAGRYELLFSLPQYEKKSVSDIDVPTNDFAVISVTLAGIKPAVTSTGNPEKAIEGVVITKTRARAETVNALLTQQKNSIRVSDGISAETIRRTPDRTTSDVLKRVSGASIQDNKFVIIRGLNDRYNASYLNGGPLPSSEPDRKAFSFDIFPANMIDNLVIYKTATPDLPGEFAGGVIDITTKSTSDKNFQSISIGGGYNDITTGKKQLYADGTGQTFIGSDNGSRKFPEGFPTSDQFRALQNNRTEANLKLIDYYTKASVTDWSIGEKDFAPNYNFNYTIARRSRKNMDFGYIASVTKTVSNTYNTSNRRTYEYNTVNNLVESSLEADLNDNSYNTQTLFGAIANFSLKVDNANSFSFKNLFSQNSTNTLIERNGALNQDSDKLMLKATSRLFTGNTIYTGQLNGDHNFTKPQIKLSWTGTFSKVARVTPRDRRNSYVYFKNEDGTATTPTASIGEINVESPGSMYSSRNDETILSSKVDLSRKFKIGDEFGMDVKMGGFIQSRDRQFNARLIGYVPFAGRYNGANYGFSTFDSSIATMDDAHIFALSNMGVLANGKSGLMLKDGSKGNDQYDATSRLKAGYLMFDNSYKAFRLIWGARYESYNQKLNSRGDNGAPVNIDKTEDDLLPSANLIVALNKKQNLRFSYSKTLNRPEFRELAPFLFYDFITRYNTQGTPELEIAKVQNADARYEIFPGRGQLFSISAFYKKFDHPIELQALANNSNKYQNALSGENKGIEVEYRTLLSTLTGAKESKFLDDLTLFTNIAVIRSKVDISNLMSSSSQNIPMQGQSPYVFNAGLQYLNTDLGWAFAANINRIGDRIAIHANQTQGASTPALWEKGRTFLDMQLAKSFMKNSLELKFNVQNLLAQRQLFYMNNDTTSNPAYKEKKGVDALFNSIFTGDKQNLNGYDKDVDDEVWSTNFGRVFSLTATYNF